MHVKTFFPLAIVLTGVTALSLASSKPAAAQIFTCTLSGVTFDDCTVATGNFTFDSTAETIINDNITTTTGVTSLLPGAHYAPFSSPTISYAAEQSNRVFEFQSASGVPYNYLLLLPNANITRSGTYLLQPGFYAGTTLDDSQEVIESGFPFTTNHRAIVTGSLVVTPAAVPEASTTVSLGLLLALGAGAFAVARQKKPA